MEKFIPALRYGFLTPFFDFFLRITFPEYKFKNQILDTAKIKEEDYVLDFGCGTGTLLVLAKKRVNARMVGVEVDKEIIKIAVRKISKNRLNIDLKTYDGKTLPFKDNTFNKVLSSLVFHHLEDKNNALKEIYRVLKKDGCLVLGDFGRSKNKLMAILAWIFSNFENTKDNIKGLIPEYMKRAGFRDIKELVEMNTMFGSVSIYVGYK